MEAPQPVERLVFSATEAIVDAGGVFELPVPIEADGSFLIYDYEEKSGSGIHFTVVKDDFYLGI